MAAPNLIAPSTINGKTTYISLASTSETLLLSNTASSGKALRVHSIYAANIDGSNAVDVTLKIYDDDTAGTGYSLASTVSVPADSTVVLVNKDAPVWLEEDRRLTVTASAGGDLNIICSYEEIS